MDHSSRSTSFNRPGSVSQLIPESLPAAIATAQRMAISVRRAVISPTLTTHNYVH